MWVKCQELASCLSYGICYKVGNNKYALASINVLLASTNTVHKYSGNAEVSIYVGSTQYFSFGTYYDVFIKRSFCFFWHA